MKKFYSFLIFILFFQLTPGHAAALKDLASQAGLSPHKALYDIKLAGTKSGSQIINISGQMLYEWQPSCDAWISNHRFNLVYEYADSPAMNITSDFSTFETFDGETLDFISRRKRDGQLFEELRGQAVVSNDGERKVLFSQPPDLDFELPQGTLFPMGHTLAVLDKIGSGQKFFKATIFDGSDQEGPVEVNAFIGDMVGQERIKLISSEADEELLQSPARKVRLAFFPLNNPEATPDYEMSLVFHNNGIISDMFIEYDDFSVTQKLVALEPLSGTCQEEQEH